ncbi:glycosyltransferase [Hydrogenimonas urashimensis]|uniref:glycosyltransferase n=1 Tax=Hydrogenimonas urashimensis TaxID=2740515 RepID=UPI0019162C65|nr:glycosyltransferase [Hydrogenimonas urashimensis]
MMQNKKINVLQIITGLGIGGAERVVLDLATNLNQKKFNIFVVSLSKKVEMLNAFKTQNINTITLNKNNAFKDFIEIIFFLNNYIKKNNIDLIHAHMTHAMLVSSVLKILNPKLKIIFTSHNINIGSRKREFLLYLTKSLRSVDILFSKDQFKYFYKKNYKIIPNGIDIKKYLISTQKFDKFTFLSVGRLEKQKNHLLLLECSKKLKERGKRFQVLIAGKGKLRKNLERNIIQNNLENHVYLLGSRSDIPELMAKSHVFVMPSLWEGLPIVLLEAGASKLPILTTPVGSIPSLVNDSCGYLSTLNDFCNSMELILDNYNIAINKATKMQKIIKDTYSINGITKKHEKIYENILFKKNI